MIDINTTPLIDVMLVLLVMLIITIPIQLHAVNLNMPVGNPPPPLVKPEVVKIDIDNASRIYWNGELVADRADARGEVHAAVARRSQPELHLRPDKAAKYEVVAAVLAARSVSVSRRSASSAASSSSSMRARRATSRGSQESTAMDYARQRDPARHILGISFVVLLHALVI